jgi:hypothetical protein
MKLLPGRIDTATSDSIQYPSFYSQVSEISPGNCGDVVAPLLLYLFQFKGSFLKHAHHPSVL